VLCWHTWKPLAVMQIFLVAGVLLVLRLIITSAKSHLSDVTELVEERYMRRQPFFLLTAGGTLDIEKPSVWLSHIMKWPVILQ